MRKLKFRAWDGEQMVSPDYIDRNGRAHWKADSIPTYSDKVMQSTGMIDVNGNEIYEGDIIVSAGILGVVMYQAPQFIIHVPRQKSWIEFVLSRSRCPFQEVTGNIHANQDLWKAMVKNTCKSK